MRWSGSRGQEERLALEEACTCVSFKVYGLNN